MFWSQHLGSQHLGCWGQNTSRIQNKEFYATLCLQARSLDAGRGNENKNVLNGCHGSPRTCVGVQCPGNRTCYDAWNAHECVCPDGFAGLNCELNLDECLSAPCQNNGVCTDGWNAFACACTPGWMNTTCEEVDVCATADPCEHGAMCTHDPGLTVECTCTQGYWGERCGSTCVPPTSRCKGAASCDMMTGAHAHCEAEGCLPGSHGTICSETCTDITTCASLVTCQQDGAGGVCGACTDGFYGEACERACSLGSCKAGTVTCNKDGSQRQCTSCLDGFHGEDCSKACPTGNCEAAGPGAWPSTSCLQDSGEGLRCAVCTRGYWGTVTNPADTARDCSAACEQGACQGVAKCDKDGTNSVCEAPSLFQEACDIGYHGGVCTQACDQGHCLQQVQCDQDGGGNRVCSTCKAGYHGSDCTTPCIPPQHCGQSGELRCDQGSGQALTCSVCDAGYDGATCANDINECAAPFSTDIPDCITTFRLYEVVLLHMCVFPYKYRKLLEM